MPSKRRSGRTMPDSCAGNWRSDDLSLAFENLRDYLGDGLTTRIALLESHFSGGKVGTLADLLQRQKLTAELLRHAQAIKRATGQIHVVVHALGILLSLPSVLEKDEIVEQLSLGAGNAPDRRYDLETNLRVAEFTFIDWKGRDSARQDKLFKDFFLLAEADTKKRRCLYVNSADAARKLLTGGRACKSLLGRNANARRQFLAAYADDMPACDYYRAKKHLVEIIQLQTAILPESDDDDQ